MSEPPELPVPEPPVEDEPESKAVADLLKRSLSADTRDAPDVLAGVQRIIRKRSRGKFFADGWSTTQTRTNYVIVGVVTLVLVAIAYYALGVVDISCAAGPPDTLRRVPSAGTGIARLSPGAKPTARGRP